MTKKDRIFKNGNMTVGRSGLSPQFFFRQEVTMMIHKVGSFYKEMDKEMGYCFYFVFTYKKI